MICTSIKPEPVERIPQHPSAVVDGAIASAPPPTTRVRWRTRNNNSYAKDNRRSIKALMVLPLNVILLAAWLSLTSASPPPTTTTLPASYPLNNTPERRQYQRKDRIRSRRSQSDTTTGMMLMMMSTELRVLAQKTSGRALKQDKQKGPAQQRAAAQKGTFLNNENGGTGRAARNAQSLVVDGGDEESQTRQEQSVVQTTEYTEYPLPAFAMVLRLRLDIDGDDDWDSEDFANNLERVTRIHLQEVFQKTESSILEVHDEMFADLKLSVKTRTLTEDMVDPAKTASPTSTPEKKHSFLAVAFSGVVYYRFPKDSKTGEPLIPDEHLMSMAIDELLHKALVGENYLLLFRRYLSDALLNRVDDIQDLTIGTESLAVMDLQTKTATKATSSNTDGQIHTVTVVAIILFMVLSCLFLMFGSVVIMLMRDKKKTDLQHNQQAMASTDANANGSNNNNDEHDNPEHEQDARWKEHVLNVLRQVLVVRRQWRRQMRQWHRQAKKQWKERGSRVAGRAKGSYPGDESYVHDIDFNDQDGSHKKNPNNVDDDDDDDDDSVYYDEDARNDEAWLDEWSKILTSIPLTNVGSSPSKKKKSHATLAPRPAHRQARHQSLQCIDEEADASSVVSAGSSVSPTFASGTGAKVTPMQLDFGATLEEGSDDESDEEGDILASARMVRRTVCEDVTTMHAVINTTYSGESHERDAIDGNPAKKNQPTTELHITSLGSGEMPSFDELDGKDSSPPPNVVDYAIDRALI